MLDSGVFLQLAIAAVIVGCHKTFVADDFASAEMTEGLVGIAQSDNGIFDATLIDAVDVVGGEFKTGLLHVGIVFADEREKPHAFVGTAGGGSQNQKGQR